MFEKLEEIEKRFSTLEQELGDPEVLKDQKHYQAIAKEHAELTPIVDTYRELKRVKEEISENKALLQDPDPEISALAKQEIQDLQKREEELTSQLKLLLIPKDPNDEKNVLLEIRAGTGGEEAALFAADLFRMYSRYAERNRWKIEVLSSHPTGIGGFKEIIALVSGKGVYSRLSTRAVPTGSRGFQRRRHRGGYTPQRALWQSFQRQTRWMWRSIHLNYG